MPKLRFFSWFLLLNLVPWAAAFAMDVDSESTSESEDWDFLAIDFEDIRSVCEKILKIFPPEKYFILGLGQSPTPVIAYLQTEHQNYAKSIPLTNFRYGVDFADLKKNAQERLDDHFSYFLPNPKELGTRSFVLIDFASHNGGHSLLAVSRYLERYLNSTYQKPPQVSKIALKDNENLVRVPYRINYVFVFNSDNQFIKNLGNNIYKPFSPFGEFNIYDFGQEALTRERPQFRALKQKIQALKMERIKTIPESTKGTLPFALKHQTGTLQKTWDDLDKNKEQQIEWYVHQLGYYRGPDLPTRLAQVLGHPKGREKLLNLWRSFIGLPQIQKKLLQTIMASNDMGKISDIAQNLHEIAEPLRKDFACLMFKIHNPQITEQLSHEVPDTCSAEFVDIFKELIRDDNLKLCAQNMLDGFLMPDFLLRGDNFENLKNDILERFGMLLDDPATRHVAMAKYQSYLSENLTLPKITLTLRDPDIQPNFHFLSLSVDHYNILRTSILKKVGELCKASNDMDISMPIPETPADSL